MFMRQSAERGPADDAAGHCWARPCMFFRHLQLQRLMRPILVVVPDELAEQISQVPPVDHDDVVQALSAQPLTRRSAVALACGVPTGVNTVLMSIGRARAMQSPPDERSRSRIRKRGPVPHGGALINGRHTHSAFGCAVMFRRITVLRSWARKKKACSV